MFYLIIVNYKYKTMYNSFDNIHSTMMIQKTIKLSQTILYYPQSSELFLTSSTLLSSLVFLLSYDALDLRLKI